MVFKSRKMGIAIGAIFVIIISVFAIANRSATSTKQLAEKQTSSALQAHGNQKSTDNSWKGFEKPSQEKLKEQLTPMQYKVTQKDGTERAFKNEYWDNKKEGIYVDLVSGEPLFSSKDKYKSGTGWPSFSQPISSEYVVTKVDYKLIYPRTQVRSNHGDSHLGHVFKDGPKTLEKSGGAAPTGLRYCMNSAAMNFIPKEDLQERGYGEFVEIFISKNDL